RLYHYKSTIRRPHMVMRVVHGPGFRLCVFGYNRFWAPCLRGLTLPPCLSILGYTNTREKENNDTASSLQNHRHPRRQQHPHRQRRGRHAHHPITVRRSTSRPVGRNRQTTTAVRGSPPAR